MRTTVAIIAVFASVVSVQAQPTLAEALNTNLVWSTGGGAAWAGQTVTTHDGVAAAQAGAIADGQESWLSTTLTGPGVLSFWWEVSSEMDYDFFDFYLGGVLQSQITGDTGWQQVILAAPGGSTTLRWRYTKDAAGTALGEDRAWLDEVVFVPQQGPPAIAAQLQSQTAGTGDTVTFVAGIGGAEPLSYLWFYNETNAIADATKATLNLANVQLDNTGTYSVIATNAEGAVTNNLAVLTVTTNGPVTQVLLFCDQPATSPYQTALLNLGQAYQLFTDFAAFNLAVGSADVAGTLVMVDSCLSNNTLTAVGAFANAGGRALLQYWAMNTNSSLAAALGATVVTPILTAPPPLYEWGGSPFFAGLSSPVTLSQSWQYNGHQLQPRAGAQAVAGFASLPAGNVAAMVIGHSGRCVVNGCLLEETGTAAVTLARNQIKYLLDLAESQKPSITTQPQSQSVFAGRSVRFFVGARGSVPMSYQWVKDGTNLLGATDFGYSVANVQADQTGGYSVVVTNLYGATTSTVASLSLSVLQPVTKILVFVDGTGYYPSAYLNALTGLGLTYQSYTDFTGYSQALAAANPLSTLAIIDAINYSYSFGTLETFVSAGGRAILQYWDLRAGSSLAAAFNVAVVQVNYSPPSVYNWGSSGLFASVASPLTFYDYFNVDGQKFQPTAGGQAVAGYTASATANQAALVIGNNGRTLVNGFPLEEVTSSSYAVQLAKNEIQFLLPPVITAQPQDCASVVGASACFSVSVSGATPFSYQWYFNQTNALAGQTTSSLALPAVQLADAGLYSVVVTNSSGAVTSRLAVLSVYPVAPLTIGDATLIEGDSGTTNALFLVALATPSDQLVSVDFDTVNGSATAGEDYVAANGTLIFYPGETNQTIAVAVMGDTLFESDETFRVSLSHPTNVALVVGPATGTIVNDDPLLPPMADRTISENSLLTCAATNNGPLTSLATIIADFEGYANGTANGTVMFRDPRNSGSTASLLDLAPNLSSVTNVFPAGNPSTRALRATWSFTNYAGVNPWLRLTTFSPTYLPNPTIPSNQRVRFDLYADRALGVALGVRETSTTAAIGANGGTSGSIEFVGATKSGSMPVPVRTVTAGAWTTLEFDFPTEVIAGFTGNGILETSTGKGVLEHLALVPAAGRGTYNIYLDNFTVVSNVNTYTFSLDPSAPAGATIDPKTGVFSWTPTEAQGPGVYTITIHLTNNVSPPLSDSQTFTVTVNEVNSAPVLSPIASRTVQAGTTLLITNTAIDVDVPANALSFSLELGESTGAAVDPVTGVFTWTPTDLQTGSNYFIVRVADDGEPNLSASQDFAVTVVVSPLFIEAISLADTNVTLVWTAIPGRSYQVQFQEDLTVTNWTDLPPPVVASGTTAMFTDTNGIAAQRFYRVMLVP